MKSYITRISLYEAEKKALQGQCLSPREYEQAIKKLADKLKI